MNKYRVLITSPIGSLWLQGFTRKHGTPLMSAFRADASKYIESEADDVIKRVRLWVVDASNNSKLADSITITKHLIK